jgi:hypothetical protein
MAQSSAAQPKHRGLFERRNTTHLEKKYEYRPLKEPGAIRLIELQPSTDQNARLECTLLHTTFGELSDEVVYHYCALSYVWGSSKDTMPILVDEKDLLVTVSLGTALLHLRDPRIPRYLWADAICINQNDDDEKSIQVTQMGEVYKAARHTIIWLGEATIDGLGEEVLSCIRTSSKSIQTKKGFTKADGLAGPIVLQEPSYVAILEVSMGSLNLNDLEALLDLSWFTRVWIYQELLFSPDPWLQLGRTRIRWSELSTVVSSLSDKNQLREPCKRFLAMDKARQSFHAQSQRENRSRVLLNTLVARRGLGVLDPRDMIFAHLGIVAESPLDGTPEKWNLLRVDYKKDCAELYRDVAQYLSRRIEIFELLSHVETISNLRHSGTPSWAPNWMVRPFPSPYRRLYDSISVLRKRYQEMHGSLESRLDNGSGSMLLRTLPDSYQLWISPSIISFLGFRMGTVCRISDIINHYGSSLNSNPIYAPSQNQQELHSEIYRQIYGRWWNICSSIVEEESTFKRMFQLAFERLESQPQNLVDLTDDDLFVHVLLHESRPDNKAYPHFLFGRKLALVPGCGLALVPSAANLGDIVCFFLEKTTVPFLLRPVSIATKSSIDSTIRDSFIPRNPGKILEVNHFEFIGECILQDFIFSSIDGRYFTDVSGERYPGSFEAFVIH